jgi:hypothetical protein
LVARLESDAPNDSSLRELLSWAIPSDPHDQIWSRLRRVAGQMPW